MPSFRFARTGLVAVIALAAALAGRSAFADRNKLWEIVHDECAPAQMNGAPLPKPCLRVDLEKGDAVIKDRTGVAQLLDIPTARVTGIEDPQLLAPGAPNYFALAWAARDLMRRYLANAPQRDGLSIAVNSSHTRSQDQLHLHVDCLAPDVAAALGDYAPHIDTQWRPMTVALAGRKYWARRVDAADLKGADPFRLLADGISDAAREMGLWSLAAVPAPDRPGFLLLADHAELAGGGYAEDLQDHACRIAK